MPKDVIAITGLEETKQGLRDLPQSIVRDFFPDALAAGGAVMEREVRVRTPRAIKESTSGKEYGPLTEHLGTDVEIDTQRLEGSAKSGFTDDGFPARFLEFGHRQITHAGAPAGQVVAHPFMRPAAAAAEDEAVEAFAQHLAENIE